MLIRYAGGNFYDLITQNKNFVWLIYVKEQLNPSNTLALKPTWIKNFGVIPEFIQTFPNVTFVESLDTEVRDELFEIGYKYSEDGIWDEQTHNYRPIIIGFEKGWKVTDSNGKCYCTETLSDIIFRTHPKEFDDYLNQPV
jgi:hypothetical protein